MSNNKVLICTKKGCKKAQDGDGEFCAKHYPTNEYNIVIDALNMIDEQAENGNSEYDEEVERGKAYEIVATFIDKHASRKMI